MKRKRSGSAMDERSGRGNEGLSRGGKHSGWVRWLIRREGIGRGHYRLVGLANEWFFSRIVAVGEVRRLEIVKYG